MADIFDAFRSQIRSFGSRTRPTIFVSSKRVTSIESTGIKPPSPSKGAGVSAAKRKTAAGLAAIGGAGLAAASLALYSGASISSRSNVSGSESQWAPMRAQVAQLPETVRSSQDAAQQMPRGLEHEPEPHWARPVTQTIQSDAFSGTQGRVRVTWHHEGVVYNAVVVTDGTGGSALVNYVDPLTGIPVGAEEDLELVRNTDGVFYVGANPRVPGTGVPHPFYMRDIFKLTPLPNGSWTISEVGYTWMHFDRAGTVAQ